MKPEFNIVRDWMRYFIIRCMQLEHDLPEPCTCAFAEQCKGIKKELNIKEDIEKKYMDSGGSLCPYCDSDNITADPIEADAGCASGVVRCKECGKSWTDYYNLAGIGEEK